VRSKLANEIGFEFQFPGSSFTKVPANDNHYFVIDNERQVLRALCQGALASRASLLTLRSYRWRESLHHVIFEFLINMPGANAELWRERLPAYLTRRGVPDFDLSWLQPNAAAEEDVERLIQRLTVTANNSPPPALGSR
jgi:hypothetical protein